MTKTKALPKKINKISKKQYRIVAMIVGVVAGLLVLIGGFALYVKAYQNRILPNTEIGGISVGGLTQEKAEEKLNNASKIPSEGKVKLRINDKTPEESTDNLGLNYDVAKSVENTYFFGHENNYLQSYWHHFQVLVIPRRTSPELESTPTALEGWVNKVASEVDEPLQNANIEVQNGEASISEPRQGKLLNQQETYDRILTAFLHFTLPDLVVERQDTLPQISKADAEAMVQNAKDLVKDSLYIEVGGDKFTVTSNKIGKWIELKINSKTKEKYVSFNDDDIRLYLDDSVAPSVNVTPRDAKFSFSGGKMTAITKSVDGKTLDTDVATSEIIKTLESKTANRTIAFELKTQVATINENLIGAADKLGIKERIGTATTSFGNSPSNRIHNIKNGAQYLSGIIIAPGETFSTVGHLGRIDGSSGYLPELVIKEDRTIPEFGGGLCQVSTTLFRAAMHSGLNITERANHSYRVSYYEPPVGMDATIYSPRPDLKFVNNTPAHILVQSSVSGNQITFDLYGTSDDRRVEISNPEVYDIVSPGDTIYVDDSGLAPGETKQVEKAHNGSKAVFYYKVLNSDGSTKLQQTFRSYYVPWPARVLRGPEKPAEG